MSAGGQHCSNNENDNDHNQNSNQNNNSNIRIDFEEDYEELKSSDYPNRHSLLENQSLIRDNSAAVDDDFLFA